MAEKPKKSKSFGGQDAELSVILAAELEGVAQLLMALRRRNLHISFGDQTPRGLPFRLRWHGRYGRVRAEAEGLLQRWQGTETRLILVGRGQQTLWRGWLRELWVAAVLAILLWPLLAWLMMLGLFLIGIVELQTAMLTFATLVAFGIGLWLSPHFLSSDRQARLAQRDLDALMQLVADAVTDWQQHYAPDGEQVLIDMPRIVTETDSQARRA